MNRFVFFIFVFFVSAFASCSSKKEAIRVEMDKSIRDQINMILDSRKKNSNNSIDVSFINGKVRIHEVEYYEKPDSVTNEPVVKKETTKSSTDMVNANMNPVIIPGLISGSTTLRIA